MQDCISKNKDKKSPGGYCASLHKKITGEYPTENYTGEEMKEKTTPTEKTGTFNKYCTIQITSDIKSIDTEMLISKIASMYQSMYNRANQTLDASKMTSVEMKSMLNALKDVGIKAKAVESPMLENLHERMNKVLGTESQSVTQKKNKEKPLEPKVIKENEENPFEKYDSYELLIGATVELEHTNNVIEALEIAIDHLDEKPDYYSTLLTYVEPDFNPVDDMKGKKEQPEESDQSNKGYEMKDIETKEYQTPGGSNLNVGRMIKNMSRMKMPKFDSRRNLADRFKTMFKMSSPKDDMNAALQTRESYKIVGKYDDEKSANDILKSLLIKKRNAQLMIDKDGKRVVIVEENYGEDNTMANSSDVLEKKIIKKKKVKSNGNNGRKVRSK